jgi:hypothetical protein
MTLQYILAGGQLKMDKRAFAGELLIPDSPIKLLLPAADINMGRPKITRDDKCVTIDYNDAQDIILNEGFFDLFRKLKRKYREKLQGRVVIRITALTSYHVILNMNTDDDRVIYE